ncbi:MAG: CPBP family intramembrane metalloprotease [Chitinophagales bacterium]|nr:CPBP family intramembrane metalloprotease [Chitinophagales bacterium]
MFLNQANKGLNDWWRYVIGIAIVIIAYFLGQIPLFFVAFFKLASNAEFGGEAFENFTKNMDFESIGISKNIGFTLLILMFAISLLGLWFVIRNIHNRKMLGLITPNNSINVKKILFGFGLWMALNLVIELISYWINPAAYTFRWAGVDFVVLFLIALFLLPIQTSFEELFFRGYIMQGVALIFRYKWVPILVSSVLFGLIHGMNPEIEQYGFVPMQSYYIAAGLFLAIITVLDDGLELALGVHAATNFFGATLLTYQGSVIQTDTLFATNEIDPWMMLFGFLIAAAVFIYICGQKYQWQGMQNLIHSDDFATNSDNNEF